MKKADFIRSLAEKVNSKSGTSMSLVAIATVLESLEECVIETLLEGEEVRLPGFVTILSRHVKGYTGRNPKNGLPLAIADRHKVVFKVGKNLKDAVADQKKKK